MLAGQGAAAICPRTGSTGSLRGRWSMRVDHAPAAMMTCSALILPAGVFTPVGPPGVVGGGGPPRVLGGGPGGLVSAGEVPGRVGGGAGPASPADVMAQVRGSGGVNDI